MTDPDTDNPRVLFVDDDPDLLEGIARSLFDDFDVQTAPGGQAALDLMAEEAPFEVIVSDMRMPNMDGAQFLTRARASAPDSVRILLTGQTDLSAAVAAVNDGNIFRFLCKPCPTEELTRALNDGIRQHRLMRAERELLEHTLMGAVEVLTDVLSVASPTAFARAYDMRGCVQHMAAELSLPAPWRFEIAALLSLLGSVALPGELVARAQAGLELAADEAQLVAGIPETTYGLLSKIPRLEDVAAMIRGTASAPRGAPQTDIEWGSAMLRAAATFEQLRAQGQSPTAALAGLSGQPAPLVEALRTFHAAAAERITREVGVRDLQPGMLLRSAVTTRAGNVLLPAGRELTLATIARIENFARSAGVHEPILVDQRVAVAA